MVPITPPAGTNRGHGLYTILNNQYRRSLPERFPSGAVIGLIGALQRLKEDNQEKPLTASIWEILHG